MAVLPPGYPWPGNVRELEQAVRRALLTGRYTGNAEQRGTDEADVMVRAVRSGVLNAQELMTHYCNARGKYRGTFTSPASPLVARTRS